MTVICDESYSGDLINGSHTQWYLDSIVSDSFVFRSIGFITLLVAHGIYNCFFFGTKMYNCHKGTFYWIPIRLSNMLMDLKTTFNTVFRARLCVILIDTDYQGSRRDVKQNHKVWKYARTWRTMKVFPWMWCHMYTFIFYLQHNDSNVDWTCVLVK